jgi:hypothetical protein
MQSCGCRKDRLDNGPGRFHRVFPNEQQGISMHGISQKTLIGINFVRGAFLDCRKLGWHGDEFFAGTLHPGAEAERYLTWTETEAEMIARLTSQIVERRFSKPDQHFGSRKGEALSGANQERDT